MLFAQTDRTGVGSIPLVLMVSFFLGLTMALLTGYQLEKFGTERLVPTLISIAFTRELGPLLTGIVLAARIGAAYTAELGTMQVSEEVEAIEAMGIGPLRFLVAPRLVAIASLMPCLSVLSVVAALIGSALISWAALNLVPDAYFDAVVTSLIVSDIVIGLFKAMFFGLLIGLIACYQGLTVTGGAEGVGKSDNGQRGDLDHHRHRVRYAVQRDGHKDYRMSETPLVHLENIVLRFGEKTVLDGIDLKIFSGDRLVDPRPERRRQEHDAAADSGDSETDEGVVRYRHLQVQKLSRSRLNLLRSRDWDGLPVFGPDQFDDGAGESCVAGRGVAS